MEVEKTKMTRKDEIACYARDSYEQEMPSFITGLNQLVFAKAIDKAFCDGAEWADGHPKSPWIKPEFGDCVKGGCLYDTVKQGDIYLCSLGGDDYECSALKFPDGLYMLTTSSKLVAAFSFDCVMKLPRKPNKDNENTSR